MIKKWKKLDSKYLITSDWINVRADRCKRPDGGIVDPYYVIEERNWVYVIAFNSDMDVLVVRQYRHGAGIITVEFPSGDVALDKESPIEGAKRELLEETGCTAESFDLLMECYSDPSRYTNKIFAFMARGAQKVCEPSFDENECIESEFISPSELAALVREGSFCLSHHLWGAIMAMEKVGQKGWCV
ncbi:MAG: NUDIX hydrolase [Candidatus Dadabacteria bacterium]|nr:MAG: NUDIX hydrolase [Candidatus Dadabacteria bacterium]